MSRPYDETVPSTPSRLAHHSSSVRATWWYSVVPLVLFEALIAGVSAPWIISRSSLAAPVAATLFAIGLTTWIAGSIVLLRAYLKGPLSDEGDRLITAEEIIGLVGGLVFAASLLVIGDPGVLAASAMGQLLVLLRWPRGTRSRVTVLTTVALIALFFTIGVPAIRETPVGGDTSALNGAPMLLLTALLPLFTSFTLWWWDIVVQLDQARTAAAALATTNERLRVANDVHDLQGHHLQVIALQLELSERLMPTDPEAALAQLRVARASVDAARQGTRDLAMRLRGAPLPDEVRNAADLLTAAGLDVTIELDPTAGEAPVEALGPVVRETTTNALTHGAGAWAHIRLARDDSHWHYEITNDRRPTEGTSPGTGLASIRERIGDAGGEVEIRATDDAFTVHARVPASPAQTPTDITEAR